LVSGIVAEAVMTASLSASAAAMAFPVVVRLGLISGFDYTAFGGWMRYLTVRVAFIDAQRGPVLVPIRIAGGLVAISAIKLGVRSSGFITDLIHWMSSLCEVSSQACHPAKNEA
jgi:hypothetical protein